MRKLPWRLVWAVLLLGGCYGKARLSETGERKAGPADSTTGAPADPSDPAHPADPTVTVTCTSSAAPPAPLRRLSNFEYGNAVNDLLGTSLPLSTSLATDPTALGFDNNGDAQSTTEVQAQKYLEAAEAASNAANLTALLSCDPTAGTPECAQAFIATVGRRAFRRPLTSLEQTRLYQLFQAGQQQLDFAFGARLVLQALLQSADFLYRPELGRPELDADGRRPLSDLELASRLSFFLWGSIPDEPLLSAAEQQLLHQPEELEAQARRMLADPRAHAMVAHFHAQWGRLADLAQTEKDPVLFPKFAQLRPAMQKESELFFEHAFWDADARLSTLFDADWAYVNGPLAAFYGVSGVSGTSFVRATLDSTRRKGFLTRAALLSVLAKPNETHPILRGKYVREALLCQQLQSPPDNLAIVPPEPDPNATTRQRYAEHSANPACSGCHAMMDPIGFGFENYGADGAWRDTENGLPVDGTGTLTVTDEDGPFANGAELSAKLAGSQMVEGCVVTQWFRYLSGRGETDADACSLSNAQRRLEAAGGHLPELLVAMTQTDSFRYRDPFTPGGSP